MNIAGTWILDSLPFTTIDGKTVIATKEVPKTKKPSQKNTAEALKILDGLGEIAKNEMLIRGEYVTQTIRNKSLFRSGAICGGHKACLIGSTWLAAGVKTTKRPSITGNQYVTLPGVLMDRVEFLETKPGLSLAVRALDEAARRFVKRHPSKLRTGFVDDYGQKLQFGNGWSAEALFEHGLKAKGAALQAEVLKLSRHAKRLVKTDAVR